MYASVCCNIGLAICPNTSASNRALFGNEPQDDRGGSSHRAVTKSVQRKTTALLYTVQIDIQTQVCIQSKVHTKGGVQRRTLLRRVLRRVLKTAFEKVLRRVLRRCLAVGFSGKKGSEKGS